MICLTDAASIVVFQGSLLACQAIADQRQLSYKLHSTAQELNQQYPLNAKEGYQGLFEDGAGSINVRAIKVGTFVRIGALFLCISLETILKLSGATTQQKDTIYRTSFSFGCFKEKCSLKGHTCQCSNSPSCVRAVICSAAQTTLSMICCKNIATEP